MGAVRVTFTYEPEDPDPDPEMGVSEEEEYDNVTEHLMKIGAEDIRFEKDGE